MGTNTIDTAKSNGDVIDASDHNEHSQALTNQFVGRNTSGVAEAGKSLGTTALPWGTGYLTSLVLNGEAVDISKLTSEPNRVVSGPTRTLSSLSEFLQADGATNAFTLLGATTNILLSINSAATTVSTDIVVSSLSLAPSSNNTCNVNDTNMSNDLYAGEDGTVITIDAVGTEISSRVGEYITLKSSNGEYLYAYVKDATTLTNVFRGFFFDDTLAPVERANLSNNDVLTFMATGYVFVENNGTTVNVTYNPPVHSSAAPSSPASGDYWYDMINKTWKRYDGSSFVIINRTLVGMVVVDTANCVASRSMDYSNVFTSTNNLEVEPFSTSVATTKDSRGLVSVYGSLINLGDTRLSWNITTDLASGLTEANSTIYYLYLSDTGRRVIDTRKPHYRPDLQGYYHPYESWRNVGEAYNDSSGDFEYVYEIKRGSVAEAKYALNAIGVAPIYACRAWVNFNGTGVVAIRASGNVSSITDNGTGSYQVNFTEPMKDENYSAIVTTENNTGANNSIVGGVFQSATYTKNAMSVSTHLNATGQIDRAKINVAIFR